MSARIDWSAVLAAAREVVESYDTPVTLRQVHYRLVASGTIPNTTTAYKTLSDRTAKARRRGEFPELADLTREVHRPPSWADEADALGDLAERFRVDRTQGQEVQLWIGVEKATLLAQVWSWLSPLGLPMIPLRGYASQTFADQVVERVQDDPRPAVLVYAGDLDPSGEDIDRDFIERTGCWKETVRVAVNEADVSAFDLRPMPGKSGDSRAASFRDRHGGDLFQVEVEAMDPDDLRAAFYDAIGGYRDDEPYRECREREAEMRARLRRLAEIESGGGQ